MAVLQTGESLARLFLLLLLTLSAYISRGLKGFKGLLQFLDPLKEDHPLAIGCFVVSCPEPTEPGDQQSIHGETYPNHNRFYNRNRNPANDPGNDG
jgi:hypothetical protein